MLYMVARTSIPFEANLFITNDIISVKEFNQPVIDDWVIYF